MQLATFIVFFPLLGAILAGLFGNQLGTRNSQLITTGLVGASALMAIITFFDVAIGHNAYDPIVLGTWFNSGSFKVEWALRVDTLTAVMLVVVTLVSSLVHLYSWGYMSDDETKAKFFAYLSLFTFAMLMLVTADNLVQMFFGWEGVGVCSYLLIGYYYTKPSANAAAIKAFVVNRVGDFGFALGIFGCFVLFDAVAFDDIFAIASSLKDAQINFLGFELHAMTTLCLLLFVGAMGKSAQLGLHTWLPDAMEGPTPVSALIHAATMVTAGVFMVARLSPIFEFAPSALEVVTIVGALTAFVAATIGLTQFDIKRVIAYSTMSQLGYMFFALGVSAYSAAMFHLMTHAFFKALLFLGAGSVIHALHHEQDMRNMGGIRKKIPVTYWTMMIGSLALAGIGFPGFLFGLDFSFGFAGFYSKDIILESAFAAHSFVGTMAYWLGVAAAFMTAFYSFRLMFLTFHGKYRGDQHTYDHAHESPWVMLLPLLVLAVGALFAGAYFYEEFVGHHREAFWGDSIFVVSGWAHDIIDHAHHVEKWVKVTPLFAGIAGILMAIWFYLISPGMCAKTAGMFSGLNKFFFNKWYFDEAYNFLFVLPAAALGRLFWKVGDVFIIDGFGPNGIASLSQKAAKQVSRLQTGYVFQYAFAMLIGVVVLATWFFFGSR